jgi:putative ABC transport system ATP-binding protein
MIEKKEAIVCTDITKTFGTPPNQTEALRGVSLKIMEGEMRMLMGPSGSGKTTLISVIAAILTQDKGTCIIDHTNLQTLSDQEKTRFRGKNIGFVFQAFNLIPMLTVEENVSIPLLLNGSERGPALEKAKAMLHEVGLGDKIGAQPFDLSGGQQQRVAIARAVVHSPKVVVCDEPTSFLDIHTGLKIMTLLRSLIEKFNTTLIVVTHDNRITQFADHIDHLEDGLIVSHES